MGFSVYIIPAIIFLILCSGAIKKVHCFTEFTSGAKDGIMTVIKLVPSLIGLIVAVNVFRASGILDTITNLLTPVMTALGLAPEVLPLVAIRPVSGSASLAVLDDILKSCGPDSAAGFTASVMMGSTETIFYTIAIYTGDTGIKKAPWVLTGALAANIAAAVCAGLVYTFIQH